MAGRKGQPINLLLLKGAKHLTQEEIDRRKQAEESLKSGISKFHPTDQVLLNPIAKETFIKLLVLYENIDYIEGLDEAIINRYCLMTAEADRVQALLIKMEEDIDKCEKPSQMVSMYKAIASAEITVGRIRDRLLQMEDRLFMNPTSRVRNVPKKDKEKPKTDFDKQFGDV
jgi:phage terminase small subunit